ncbi:hypothetical protein CGH02_25085, partial [Vibrio parahaemolyticus]
KQKTPPRFDWASRRNRLKIQKLGTITMKFLGTFKQTFEAHEVKPHLRDIAMFVTLNNTRLYPREQFDENGDIHP